MKSNYKPIGDLVERVDNRNKDGAISNLLGLSIDKKFIPSVANTIGTDLSTYKIIQKNDFAVSLMQVSRDSKIPIACQKEYEEAIMSPAYSIFRVKDTDEILPDYLELWFKRSEFDREAAFIAVGGVRGSMPWEEFARIKVYVPLIEKQAAIVKQYKTIADRIAFKQKINDNLGETINTVFEKFYIEKCQHEVSLSDLCNLSSSKRVFADQYVEQGTPFYRGGEITLKQKGEPITTPLYISDEHYKMLKKKYGVPVAGDILITAVGTIGNSYLVEDEDFYFKDGNIIWLRNFVRPEYGYFMYDYMQSSWFHEQLDGICIGSTQTALTIAALSQIKIEIPDNNVLKDYARKSQVVRQRIQYNQKELLKLHETLQFLLSSLTSC